jgi:hypothetical protein
MLSPPGSLIASDCLPRRTVNSFIVTDVDIDDMSEAELKIEIERRHAIERRDKTLKQVHDLEKRLGIHARWTPEGNEWQAASTLALERQYRLALDRVQALVISRLLELGKVNLAGTGTPQFGLFIYS